MPDLILAHLMLALDVRVSPPAAMAAEPLLRAQQIARICYACKSHLQVPILNGMGAGDVATIVWRSCDRGLLALQVIESVYGVAP